MALNILRKGEGGLRRREEEREGARGGGEALAAAAPLLGASVSTAPPRPGGVTPTSVKSSTIFRTLCFLSYSMCVL